MKRVVVALFAVACVWATLPSVAVARKQYKEEFDAKYVKASPTTQAEKDLAAVVGTAKCLICHGKDDEGKESKKVRNAYGQAFGKNVGKKNEKDTTKIAEALEKAAAEHSDAAKSTSPTFGDLIKEGKLPVSDK